MKCLSLFSGIGGVDLALQRQGHEKQNGRKVNTDYTFALTTREEQIIADGHRIRSFTPLECERLQGFPDNFSKFGRDGELISDAQRFKVCGNAITIPVVEFILERLSVGTS